MGPCHLIGAFVGTTPGTLGGTLKQGPCSFLVETIWGCSGHLRDCWGFKLGCPVVQDLTRPMFGESCSEAHEAWFLLTTGLIAPHS